MRVRDAVEEDGEVLGELADAPAEVMRNVVHDRTVRVAESDAQGDTDRASATAERERDDESGDRTESDEPEGKTDDSADESGDSADESAAEADESAAEADESAAEADEEGAEVVGFVGFDAMPGTVRVTYLRGTRDARERLLEEPVRFARKEGMVVEALVPEDEAGTKEVVQAAGFERTGTGPRFEGGRTLEYRLDPSAHLDSARR